MRLLMWILLACLVYLALRKQVKNSQSNSQSNMQSRPPSGETQGEAMLPCAVCQVFIPESEAIMRHGQAFCCNDHADLSR